MRYYEKTLPDVDEVVMCQVRQIAEMGAYVKLLEYDNAEGMILLSELSRRRIRSIQKLIRVGRNEVVVVLRVDKEKGYIDLSKRRVSADDVIKCEERYNKSKAVHSILAHVAGKISTGELSAGAGAVSEQGEAKLLELYQQIAWPLDKKFGHSYDAFKLAVSESDAVFGIPEIKDKLDPLVLKELQANIARRLTPQPVKIRSDVEVTCFGYQGIDAIRRALGKAEEHSTELVPIRVKLVAPPLYVLVSHSTDKVAAIARMEEALKAVEAEIKGDGGQVNVKMMPKTVSETEDKELERLLERMGEENAEVAGDDDDSEGEA
ncbi:hypothetical protein BDZ90DRAFT_233961 [Jaminaea rosea]|uniref:S1 motif domain-containing protein n=1 Tax=Jaminaea rosea TaxID=1569628 RepID=A0A316UJQ7_9BASI|nr:hypothetical protein BDZ90DRAFT_233961 [Jaminaea rosea]PWN25517.1 hypothetical protein BDZ90DRAFT_233961 [Jaminaea rosea]